jgi:hypothetical protein
VQAAYFSMRVDNSDMTGISSQRDNWQGLRDAQRMLAAYGVNVADKWHRLPPTSDILNLGNACMPVATPSSARGE